VGIEAIGLSPKHPLCYELMIWYVDNNNNNNNNNNTFVECNSAVASISIEINLIFVTRSLI